MKPHTEKIQIQRFQQGKLIDWEDLVLIERSLRLFINGELFYHFVCTDEYLKELTVGHLFCSGIIHSPADMISFSIDEENDTIYVETKSKRQPPADTAPSEKTHLALDYPRIISVFEQFQGLSPLFQDTGAVHSMALLDFDYQVRYFFEDMGRHNAVDKAIGKALLDGFPLARSILLASSRMPLELMKKANRAHIPAVMSVSAPTLHSIQFAKEQNMVLIGMFRNGRINIYAR